jgi:hypothetical protein
MDGDFARGYATANPKVNFHYPIRVLCESPQLLNGISVSRLRNTTHIEPSVRTIVQIPIEGRRLPVVYGCMVGNALVEHQLVFYSWLNSRVFAQKAAEVCRTPCEEEELLRVDPLSINSVRGVQQAGHALWPLVAGPVRLVIRINTSETQSVPTTQKDHRGSERGPKHTPEIRCFTHKLCSPSSFRSPPVGSVAFFGERPPDLVCASTRPRANRNAASGTRATLATAPSTTSPGCI